MDPRVFFPSGAPPPAQPLLDQSLNQRIAKLAEYAARNGPSFIEEVTAKHRGQPEYSFLFGGQGADYWHWTLYCKLCPGGQDPSSSLHSLPQPSATYAPALPAEVRSGWAQVLSMLRSSKDSITSSQEWFMACAPYAAGMAEMMADRALSPGVDFQTQLNLVYLANDILFKSQSQSNSGVIAALQCPLRRLLAAAYRGAGSAADLRQRLIGIVQLWKDRGVYDASISDDLMRDMMTMASSASNMAIVNNAQSDANTPRAALTSPPPRPIMRQQNLPTSNAMVSHTYPNMHHQPAMPTHAAAHPGHRPLHAPAPQGGPQHAQGLGATPVPMVSASSTPSSLAHHPFGRGGDLGPHPIDASSYASVAAAAHAGPPPSQQGPYPPQSPAFAVPGGPSFARPVVPQVGQYRPDGRMHRQLHPLHQPQPHHPPNQFQPPAPGENHPHAHAYPLHHHSPQGHMHHHNQMHLQSNTIPAGAVPAAPLPPRSQPRVPEEPPYDPFSFPPGLIPRLVEERQRTHPPYSPLSPLDVDRCPLPPPPEVDDYLKARLDKFYAQLADYRPGMSFCDLEEEPEPPATRDSSLLSHVPPGSTMDDGAAGFFPSSKGGGAGGARGLGYGTTISTGGGSTRDDYAAYRRAKSSSYHTMIIKDVAGKRHNKR